MAKQNINVGTTANDKKGDSLRAAFQKVNANFTELYTALGLNADGNLNIGAFEFTGSVMSTTDSTAIVIDQATTITSNLSVGGDLLPQTANGGDLGSSTLPWRSLYVSNNTIFIGGTAVGIDANGNLTTNGTVVGGGGANLGNISNGTGPTTDPNSLVSSASAAFINFASDLDGAFGLGTNDGSLVKITTDGGASAFEFTADNGAGSIKFPDLSTQTTAYNPNSIRSEGDINIEINLSDSTLRRWQFGEDGNLTFPDGTNQSTAYTGGGGGGSTLVNGAYTVSLDANGNLTFPQGTLLGYSDPGGFIINGAVDKDIAIYTYNGADAHGWTFGTDGSLTLPGDIRSAGNINIDINLTDSTLRRWQFGEDGSLILPTGGSIAAPDNQSLTLQVNGVEQLEGGGTGDTFVSGTITMDLVTGLSMSARDLPNSVNYSLAAVDWTTAVWINSEGSGYANFTGAQDLQNWWTSNGSGARAASFIEVSINGGARIPAVYNGTNGSASGVSITTTPTLPPTSPTTITTFEIFYQFKSSIDIDYDNGDLLIRAEQIGIQIESTEEFLLRSIGNNPINIQTNYGEGGPGNEWTFGEDGTLTLPNGSVIKDTDGYAVAIGDAAGSSNQGSLAVAVGAGAGYTGQGTSAVAIGRDAGGTAQGINAVAIGDAAGGTAQGINAVAIGIQAGYANQAANSIIINATGATLNQTVANTFTVKPVRQGETADAMYYNSSTGEITYAGAFSFSVAADDSTQRLISSGELVKFIGAGGITTASDAEGNITITGSGGGSVSSLVNGAYTVSLGSTGTLTVPANGIITAPINQEFQLQAKDANSLLRNEINLDPNNGTYMSVWSEEVETSYNTSDWATAVWNNESGLGAARFTGAEDLQAFWLSGPGSFVESVEVSINGGARGLAGYEGNNGGGYGVFLGVDPVPPGGPGTTVPITSLVFYYRTKNRINIDRDGGQLLLNTQYMNIDLETNSYINLKSTRENPVRIITNKNTHMWEFDSTGSLTLPREGKIYGIGDGGLGGNRYGYISWDGESSGDGSGFNTMRLVPDLQGLEDLDQYIIIDPTGGVPGHIHIRAGGTQDNSLAHLYLGGEHSHVKISAGLNPPVTVMADDNAWIFGTDGDLTVPGDIKSTANTSIIIDGGVLFANVTVQTVDSFGGGVWRMFISSSAYPTVGTIVQVGDTATTAWGTPVTVTITSIVQDVGAGTWALHTNQDITTGFFFGPGTQTITINSTQVKTWTFSTDKSLTFPDGTKQTTAAQAFSFSVAADDSTQRAISNNELIKFIGAGGITTSSDAEGNITINGSGGGAYTAETFNTEQITLVGNRISTTVTNANLELECNGTGGVVINTVAEATTASTARSVGYLGLPQSGTATTATLAIGDAGKHIYLTTTSNTITIPANASVAYPIGTTLTFIAGPSATITTIAITSDTLRLAGGTSTGSRTLAANGMATAVKVASTTWYINGIGLT